MQVTSASPLPLVEMVAVSGLNSHSAAPQRCRRSAAPRRRSSTTKSLGRGGRQTCVRGSGQSGCVQAWLRGRRQLPCVQTYTLNPSRQLRSPLPLHPQPHQAASRSAALNSALPQPFHSVALGTSAPASSGL